MVSMMLYLFFLIPLALMSSWWFFLLGLMIGFFYFFNVFWFMDYSVMLSYSFGGDILSMSMIFLSFWVVLLMVLASGLIYNLKSYSSEFLLLMLLLLLILVVSFSTTSLFIFYIFFESSLVLVLFLIFGWGYQPERLKAGYYLLFYTLFASLPLLASIMYIEDVCSTTMYFLINLDINLYLFVSLIAAFLVKMPMIFVHFWLLKAHVEAPISGSMILAGVMLKLGGYGLMRVMSFIYEYSLNWDYMIIGVSLYGAVLVSVLCMYQVDMKSMIAYSSVAHMALVLCGIFTINSWGMNGALVLMVGHGLCSSGLFCLANIVYEKTHSRSFLINKGMMIFMPSMSLFWFLLSANNMGSPPSLNMLGELMLFNSVVGWSTLSCIFLGLYSFLSCCYSIYMYSYVQHGAFFSGLKGVGCNSCREYLLLSLHFIPLNFVILKSEIFFLWI
uniref:NADH-ubiquinone oxidoreductase chain 4 n=1 Tax=Polididus armatissimus TaxID=1524522 RepID=A0A9E8Y7Q9_9HEMI|nr:NADH dehydrogenase subunit 4 [Polididus armatissimus]WAJ48476.1 NADH dehydrogenase subunit 4 [Polididus armatissimus]